jgi:ABC-type branched-subunit amino acid transport system substrate-binding protein
MTARLRIGACISLTGKFGKFGQQAALGLETWRSTGNPVDLVIEDDRSDRRTLTAILPDVARRCDLLLGPYSTVLMRAAGTIAAEHGWLIWNHGGSGDDVESAHPGHVVSVLTPASRYAEPFLRPIAGDAAQLVIAQGAGSFGRQVADGAAALAQQLGIRVARDGLSRPGEWNLLTAGVFEDDAALAARAMRLPNPPRRICAVAAGVREFRNAVSDPEGVYGIAQWYPGNGQVIELGPDEASFTSAYRAHAGSLPDYPAAQAVAGAVVAMHCAKLAGSARRENLWAAATGLRTSTFFGAFGINPRTGAQARHQTVLVRWTEGRNLVAWHWDNGVQQQSP